MNIFHSGKYQRGTFTNKIYWLQMSFSGRHLPSLRRTLVQSSILQKEEKKYVFFHILPHVYPQNGNPSIKLDVSTYQNMHMAPTVLHLSFESFPSSLGFNKDRKRSIKNLHYSLFYIFLKHLCFLDSPPQAIWFCIHRLFYTHACCTSRKHREPCFEVNNQHHSFTF